MTILVFFHTLYVISRLGGGDH